MKRNFESNGKKITASCVNALFVCLLIIAVVIIIVD